ncbi:hypothetical protein SAMN05444359_11713 [Neolewinella agarilytica]|uniref:Uncharacterized protein n=1 Tax=Neolewinella agarilytica TaxID=478744 RepID=A0A1H9JCP7_9BACT|nr:hypothetical protein SAMN05444359_11713 [Neolewinella agarilytica]
MGSRGKIVDNELNFNAMSKAKNGALPTRFVLSETQVLYCLRTKVVLDETQSPLLFGGRPLALAGRTEQKSR